MSRHDHSGYPEKQNFGCCYQIIGWVIVVDIFIVWIFKAIENRNWPQPRREPSIHYIFVLCNRGACLGSKTCFFLFAKRATLYRTVNQFFNGFFFSFGYYGFFVLKIPSRNTLSPPQLSRNAPVFNVLHPMTIGIDEFFGDQFYFTI